MKIMKSKETKTPTMNPAWDQKKLSKDRNPNEEINSNEETKRKQKETKRKRCLINMSVEPVVQDRKQKKQTQIN